MELKEKVLKLINEIKTNKITIGIEPYGHGSVSEAEFQKIIKSFLGKNSFFFLNHKKLFIINKEQRRELLHINGHIGGDWYVGMDICFIPKLVFYEANIYYMGINIGQIYSDNQYEFDRDGMLYTITKAGLTKYDQQGNVLWNTPLIKFDTGKQNVQTMKFEPTHRRPDDSFPTNLISIGDLGYIEFYDKNSGLIYLTKL